MIEITTPTTVWRTMTEADIPIAVECIADWPHSIRPMNRRRAEADCYRWLDYMATHPSEYPCSANSNFSDVLICQLGGDPLAYIRYTVWGGSHKLAVVPMSTLTLNVFAIAPGFRDQGFQNVLLNELVSACFDYTAPDLVLGQSADERMNSRIDQRTYEERRTVQRLGKERERIVLSRRNYQARLTANPTEAVDTTLRVDMVDVPRPTRPRG